MNVCDDLSATEAPPSPFQITDLERVSPF